MTYKTSFDLRNYGGLRQVMTIYSIINHIKCVSKDECLSYDREFG